MPQPYPGQQWEHDWKPLTPGALKSKHHGKMPQGGNRDVIKRILSEAAATHKANQEKRAADLKPKAEAPKKPAPGKASTEAPKQSTSKAPASPKGSKSTARSLDDAKAAIKAGDNAKAVNLLTSAMRDASSKEERAAIAKLRADLAAKAMGKKADVKEASKPAAAKPKLGKKVGVDSRESPLREGDKVRITTGPNQGKEGTVTGKGRYGAVKVDVDGKESDMSPANIRSVKDAEASKKADDAIRTAAGRNTATPTASKPDTPAGDGNGKVSNAQVEKSVLDALKNTAPAHGKWHLMGQVRSALKGIPRSQQDDVIRRMMLDGKIDLTEIAINNWLSPEEQAAAIQIGPKPNHQIRLAR